MSCVITYERLVGSHFLFVFVLAWPTRSFEAIVRANPIRVGFLFYCFLDLGTSVENRGKMTLKMA